MINMINNLKRKVKSIIKHSIENKVGKSQLEQIQLANQYRLMKTMLAANDLPRIEDVGFKVYSQFEEDGILLYIFSMIDTTNKRVLEICAGNGIECMSANLIVNHGWEGLLLDGDEKLVEKGIDFYRTNELTWLQPPVFKQAWITKENVNELLANYGFEGNIDLLSLDIDGNDYHIMEAINIVQPRVIVCETQNVIPGDLAITVPYNSNFSRTQSAHPDFMGASLLAMKTLLAKRGYRLVGSHRYGFNVFFMSDNVGTDYFPEVSIESVLNNAYTKQRHATAWPAVKDLPWMKV